jgi:prevent-host-death family protein
MITMTSRDFNQDVGQAKRAAMNGPVVITDRGTPAHVLLSIEDYRKLLGIRGNAVELLVCPDTEAFDFEPEKLRGDMFNAKELS